MKYKFYKKPRKFKVGMKKNKIFIKDLGKIFLQNNEMVSFKFNMKDEYDFTKKNFGFYISQSINNRVKNHNFEIFLVQSQITGNFFLLAINKNKKKEFNTYLFKEKIKKILKFSNKNLKKLKNLHK